MVRQVSKYLRGQIYWLRGEGLALDGNPAKTRPVLIISNDELNAYSSSVTVLAVTSAIKKRFFNDSVNYPFINIDGEYNYVKCSTFDTVLKSRLGDYMFSILPIYMDEITKIYTNCISNNSNILKHGSKDDEEIFDKDAIDISAIIEFPKIEDNNRKYD